MRICKVIKNSQQSLRLHINITLVPALVHSGGVNIHRTSIGATAGGVFGRLGGGTAALAAQPQPSASPFRSQQPAQTFASAFGAASQPTAAGQVPFGPQTAGGFGGGSAGPVGPQAPSPFGAAFGSGGDFRSFQFSSPSIGIVESQNLSWQGHTLSGGRLSCCQRGFLGSAVMSSQKNRPWHAWDPQYP